MLQLLLVVVVCVDVVDAVRYGGDVGVTCGVVVIVCDAGGAGVGCVGVFVVVALL